MKPETATRSTMAKAIINMISSEVSSLLAKINAQDKIVVFGAGARGIVLHEAMKATGRPPAYFVDSNSKNTIVCGLPVRDPLDLLYEDNTQTSFIIAADFPEEMNQQLTGLGIDKTQIHHIFDRLSINDGAAHISPFPLADFFLSHTRPYSRDGFKCMGNTNASESECELRIMILGGSTTDPELADIVEWNSRREEALGSWPKFFHELLNKRGIRNIVLNGGICAYTSAQETLKLIRDGVNLKPDLVIVFDGVNDACGMYWHKGRYAKFHSYFETLDAAVRPLLAGQTVKSVCSPDPGVIEDISYGIESEHSTFEEWHRNQRTMNAVCREFGIEYSCFLQPGGLHQPDYIDSCDVRFRTRWFLWNFLHSSGTAIREWADHKYSQQDCARAGLEELAARFTANVFDYEIDSKKHFNIRNLAIERFYRQARQAAQTSDYVIDVTDLFDGHDSIFFDTAHCTSEGNQLIAHRILDELTCRGILQNALKNATSRQNGDSVAPMGDKD